MSEPHAKVEDVRSYAESKFDAVVAQLSEYLTFPAISCDPLHWRL